MADTKLDYELLQQIATQSSASQRRLAVLLGVSVGKVNYCLRALVDKGWVKASNFRRSDNKLAYAYLLTPSGVSAKLLLARDFLTRKEAEFEALQAAISLLRTEVSGQPDTGVPAHRPEQPSLPERDSDAPPVRRTPQP